MHAAWLAYLAAGKKVGEASGEARGRVKGLHRRHTAYSLISCRFALLQRFEALDLDCARLLGFLCCGL